MLKQIALITAVVALTIALGVTIAASTDELKKPSSLTVHEWGTFTTVADLNGQPAQWLPLGGVNDLPCFVHYYENRLYKDGPPVTGTVLDYKKARTSLRGSVRMETPVLYFYSPKTETVQVRVMFPQGFITEWYPQATVNQAVVVAGSLKTPKTNASIVWKDVTVLPADLSVFFPQGAEPSHYYAARATDANPIQVVGTDRTPRPEKFLFYRGVGGFPVPINVTTNNEGKILVKHLTGKPSVILFENRSGKLGYRIVDTSRDEVLLDPPALTGNFETLRTELERVLIGQGLYEKEAKAMVETWRDSWFEEGTRVFYVVPSQMVNTILPLTVEPKPAQIARVFVGRVEVITPSIADIVEKALDQDDSATLQRYGRFLGPIADRIMATQNQLKGQQTLAQAKTTQWLDSALRQHVVDGAACAK